MSAVKLDNLSGSCGSIGVRLARPLELSRRVSRRLARARCLRAPCSA